MCFLCSLWKQRPSNFKRQIVKMLARFSGIYIIYTVILLTIIQRMLQVCSSYRNSFKQNSSFIHNIKPWKINQCPMPLDQCKAFEPRHDKTNKMSVRPAKTQISLGICSVWSESSLCAQCLAKDPRLWSDWADAKADLSLCRTHTHFVGFVMSWLIYSFSKTAKTEMLCIPI